MSNAQHIIDNMQGWKEIQEKAGKVSSMKAYLTNDKISPQILNRLL
jgi:hypothetical protein